MEKADITKNDALAWTNELVRLGVNSRFLSAVIASISYSGGYATSLLFSQNKDILLWLVVFSPAISIMSFYLFSQKIKISYVVFNYIIFFSLIIAETYISVNFFKIGDSFLSVGLVPIFITFALLAQWDTKHSIFAVLGTALSSFFAFCILKNNSFVLWFNLWTSIIPVALGFVALIKFRYENLKNIFLTGLSLQRSKDALSKRNEEVTASINYAKRIQDAILPTLHQIKSIFPESFVFFKPKDIVSGDFYFVEEFDNKTIVVVADCTGHGVPGAFMSMIGVQVLKDVILKNYQTTPSKILDELQEEIRTTLKQNENESRDGMDIVVVSIQKQAENYILEYAGAMNPLFYIQNETFFEIKGDKMPIGGKSKQPDFQFTNHILNFSIHDKVMIYLTSDGFQDQFGGEKGKKFMVKTLKKLLLQISPLQCEEQATVLKNTLENWQEAAQEKQTDDITIFGFRL